MKCPLCDNEVEADFVDIGVGMQRCGPYWCPVCGWEEESHETIQDYEGASSAPSPDTVTTGKADTHTCDEDCTNCGECYRSGREVCSKVCGHFSEE